MKKMCLSLAAISLVLLTPLVWAGALPASHSLTCSLFSNVDLKKSVEIQVDEEARIEEAANLILDDEASDFRLKVTLLNGDLDMNLENKKTNVTVSSATDTKLGKHPKLFIKSGTQKIAAMASCWYDGAKRVDQTPPARVSKL